MTRTLISLLACFQVAVFTAMNNVSKREAETTSRCGGCHPDACEDKYAIIPNHVACLKRSPNARPVALTNGDKIEILNYHNLLRASVSPPPANMLKLYWDDELEFLAMRWAQACKLDHNEEFYESYSVFIPGRLEVGQNIASKYETFRSVIDAWNGENKTYAKYFNNLVVDEKKVIDSIGHHAKIVWAKTGLLGCAIALCNYVPFYVCNYAPVGNYRSFLDAYDPANTIGEQCYARSTEGLCDCFGRVCENFGTLDVTRCTCSCRYSPNVGPKCAMDCRRNDSHLCGSDHPYLPDKCGQPWTTFACPHMCGYCPCIEADYRPQRCSVQSDDATSLTYGTFIGLEFRLVVIWQLILWITIK